MTGLHKDDEVVHFIHEKGEVTLDEVAAQFEAGAKATRSALDRLVSQNRLLHITAVQPSGGRTSRWKTTKLLSRRFLRTAP